MKHLIILFTLLFSYAALAQSNKDIAKAYYISAEEAYSEGNFGKCLELLNKCESALGFSGTNLEYLRVKSLMNNKEWDKAKLSSEKYFNLATDKDKSTDKYMEMVKSKIQIDEEIELIEKTKIEEKKKKEMHLAQEKLRIEQQQSQIKDYKKRELSIRKGFVIAEICGASTFIAGVSIFRKGKQLEEEYLTDYRLNSKSNPNYKSSKPDGERQKNVGSALLLVGGIFTAAVTAVFIVSEKENKKFRKNMNISFKPNSTVINDKAYHTICFNYKF